MAKPKTEPAQPSASDPLGVLAPPADAPGSPQDGKPVQEPGKLPSESLRELLQPEDVEALVQVYGYENLPGVKEYVRSESQRIANAQTAKTSLETEVGTINQQWGAAVAQAEQAIDAAADAAARRGAVEQYRNLTVGWIEALRDAEFSHSYDALPVQLTEEDKRELASAKGQPAALRMQQYARVYHKAVERGAIEHAPAALKEQAERDAGVNERLAKVLGILAQHRGGKIESGPRPAQVASDELGRMSNEEFEQYMKEQGIRPRGV